MALRTYGDKPLSFQLEEGGEYYYVGSEVSVFCVHLIFTEKSKENILTNALKFSGR